MKRTAATLIVIVFFLAGCADPKGLSKYYDLEEKRTEAIIQSIERQVAANRLATGAEFSRYSDASIKATQTPSNADDVLVAFSFGMAAGKTKSIEIPRLAPIKAPPTNVDYIRAITPILAMGIPFLSIWAYSNGSRGETHNYTATDGGKVNVGSENVGSYNKSGGAMTTTVSTETNTTCLDCEDEGEVNTQNISVDNDDGIEVPASDFDLCIDVPPAGYSSQGKPLYSPGCSCSSHYINGEC